MIFNISTLQTSQKADHASVGRRNKPLHQLRNDTPSYLIQSLGMLSYFVETFTQNIFFVEKLKKKLKFWSQNSYASAMILEM